MNLDLETLKYIKSVFHLHSDFSCQCNGYHSLCRLIKNEELRLTQELYMQTVETTTSSPNITNAVLVAVRQHEQLDEQIREFFYPKLYKLYDDKKLNKGKLPERRTAEEAIIIREFNLDGEKISIHIDIWWGGDCYDDEWVIMSADEWYNLF